MFAPFSSFSSYPTLHARVGSFLPPTDKERRVSASGYSLGKNAPFSFFLLLMQGQQRQAPSSLFPPFAGSSGYAWGSKFSFYEFFHSLPFSFIPPPPGPSTNDDCALFFFSFPLVKNERCADSNYGLHPNRVSLLFEGGASSPFFSYCLLAVHDRGGIEMRPSSPFFPLIRWLSHHLGYPAPLPFHYISFNTPRCFFLFLLFSPPFSF